VGIEDQLVQFDLSEFAMSSTAISIAEQHVRAWVKCLRQTPCDMEGIAVIATSGLLNIARSFKKSHDFSKCNSFDPFTGKLVITDGTVSPARLCNISGYQI